MDYLHLSCFCCAIISLVSWLLGLCWVDFLLSSLFSTEKSSSGPQEWITTPLAGRIYPAGHFSSPVRPSCLAVLEGSWRWGCIFIYNIMAPAEWSASLSLYVRSEVKAGLHALDRQCHDHWQLRAHSMLDRRCPVQEGGAWWHASAPLGIGLPLLALAALRPLPRSTALPRYKAPPKLPVVHTHHNPLSKKNPSFFLTFLP